MRFVNNLVPKEEWCDAGDTLWRTWGREDRFYKNGAKALGVDEAVNSPTFVLEKIYLLPEVQKFKRLIHIDAYRLEKWKQTCSRSRF